jgi:hypothetical protein
VAEAHHGGDLRGRGGQHHGERDPAIGGERIGLEGPALVLGGDQRFARHQPAQAPQNLLAAGEDRLVGGGKSDGHGVSSRGRCMRERWAFPESRGLPER